MKNIEKIQVSIRLVLMIGWIVMIYTETGVFTTIFAALFFNSCRAKKNITKMKG